MPNPSELERSGMTAIEAIRWCLGEISDVPEEGEKRSRTVYDRNGKPHWIAWDYANCGRKYLAAVSPDFESETSSPFSLSLEPYTTERIEVQR